MDKQRLADIDIMRTVAILAVVLVHVSQRVPDLGATASQILGLGQYGVQIFFCISALLVAGSFKVTRFSDVYKWWRRRYNRIAPLYYYGILLYGVVNVALISIGHPRGNPDVGIMDVVANVFFVHAFVPSANNSVVPGGWSIGIEAIFYAFFPFIACFVRDALKLAVLFVLSLAVSVYFHYFILGVVNNTYSYYYPITQMPVFTWIILNFEMSGGKLLLGGMSMRQASATFFVNIGAIFALSLAMWLRPDLDVLALTYMMAPLSVVAIISLKRINVSQSISRIAKFIGEHSYSIYVNHFLCLWISNMILERLLRDREIDWTLNLTILAVMTIGSTICISIFSRSFIENAFYRQKLVT